MPEMPSISQLLERFLSDEEDHLKVAEYRACANTVDMLEAYLNRYAYASLGAADRAEWDEAFLSGRTDAYCDIFGVRQLAASIKPFHEDYLARRLGVPDLVQAHAVKVTGDLVDWLARQGLAGK